jgi:hypothetical protein
MPRRTNCRMETTTYKWRADSLRLSGKTVSAATAVAASLHHCERCLPLLSLSDACFERVQ